MVSINELAKLVMSIAGKSLDRQHTEGPLGCEGSKLRQPTDYGKAWVAARCSSQEWLEEYL